MAATMPPISIRCECGEERTVSYGETWTCDRCGRRWSTSQIPSSEYRARVWRMRRYQYEAVGLALLAIAVFAPLIVFVDFALIFIAGLVSFAFVLVYMPFWRRRVRRAAADAPRWDLRPE